MNLLRQFFYGMVVIGSLSMVGDVSVVSDVFDQLFLNAEYHHSDSRHTFILTAVWIFCFNLLTHVYWGFFRVWMHCFRAVWYTSTRSYRDNFNNKITKLPHIYAMSKFESVFPNISVINHFQPFFQWWKCLFVFLVYANLFIMPKIKFLTK